MSSSPSISLQNITLQVELEGLTSVSIVSQTDHSYSTECINLSVEQQSVLCPIPNPDYRNISSVVNVTYPYSSLHLSGVYAPIILSYNGNYTISKDALGLSIQASSKGPNLPANMSVGANDTQLINQTISDQQAQNNQDPTLSLDVNAMWTMIQNVLGSFSFTSPKLPNVGNYIFSLDGESCLQLDITDTVYKLSLEFNSSTFISAQNNIDLASLARNITSNGTHITTSNNEVSFPSTINIVANMIFSKVTNVATIACNFTTAAPTAPPQLTSGLDRYGIITNSNTSLNSLGVYYGFNTGVINSVFNYNNIDTYAALVISDSCFKVKIWIVIPIGFFVIIFPLWIDASIVEAIASALAEVLTEVTSTFLTVVTTAEGLTSQYSAQSIVAKGVQAEAAARALTTEQGWAAVAQAAEDYANKQIALAKAVANYQNAYKAVQDIQKLIDKMQELIDTLSDSPLADIVTGQSSGLDKTTILTLLQTVQSLSSVFNSALEEIVVLVDDLPDNVIKQKIQKFIQDMNTYFDMLKSIPTSKLATIDFTDPIIGIVEVIEILFDIKVIRQLFAISTDLSFLDDYNILLEELGQIVVLKEEAQLAEIGAQQNKTALETAVIGFAQDAAAAIDGAANEVANLLQINQLKNLANAGLEDAVAGVNTAIADTLGSAASAIEGAKRDNIRGMISAYLTQTLDIYQITRLGRFDENNPTERQILINDLTGTKIYSADGNNLLFSRSDFCKDPFVVLGDSVRLSGYGCDSSSDPCGVGGFNCQQHSYWFDAFQYRVSFDFYTNHDLSLGGVVIGDFDGDGVDDIMCHLPGTTKNYDQITQPQSQRSSNNNAEIVTNNEIIYSPLKALTSNGRFGSIDQAMLIGNSTGTAQTQKDWCKDGVIRVGDFNGDKKDDMLCISLSSNSSLLYSSGYTFRPAGNNSDGNITLLSSITSTSSREFQAESASLQDIVVVIGDFDGDGYSDILNIAKTSVEIFYGDPVQVFVQNTTKTNQWLSSYEAQLVACYNVGANRILTDDINNDGKDDITCIASDNSNVKTIISTISNINNVISLQESVGFARIFINDVSLFPYSNNDMGEAQNNIRANHQTHRNLFGADAVLIFNDKMLSQEKAVSDISISLDCLNLSYLTTETHISFSSDYTIPENLLWNKPQDINQNNLLLNLDVSASFKGTGLVKLISSKIQSFEYKLEAVAGGCYNTETVTHTVSLAVNFNATAKMIIENNGNLLQGSALEILAKTIASNFVIEDDSVMSLPISGQILINVLGVGYDVINHCGND